MASATDESSVRVALRIRPPIPRELIDGCRLCTSVTPGQPQVWIGGNNAFTYDYVFDVNSTQESVFEVTRGLIDGCLEGYNATILAYGQTGSGKTFTMGTGFDVETHNSVQISESQGIIPRAVRYLFSSIQDRREAALTARETPPDFTVTAQFVELYNEEVIDLIEPDVMAKSGRKGPGTIQIREDTTGGIYLVGVGTKSVLTAEDAMNCLHKGALSRTTATTNMNDQSSRSHAIYTLHIVQKRVAHSDEDEMDTGTVPELETLSAKFHFVDLAGSERLKRTGAVGDRAKEGISINGGLLSLGNVISALGDRSKKASHIPYRDSKLTRLLQDSLGGNSRTLVIACVSPCDRDFLETLNTLKYANRARNIKNRVTINQDKSSSTIALLRAQIQQLETELHEYKQGKRAITDAGDEIETDTYHENILLLTELTTLKGRIKALQATVDTLAARNAQLLAEKATGAWNLSDNNADLGSSSDISMMVQKYLREIEEMGAKLYESEAICEQLRQKIAAGNATGLNTSFSPRAITSMTTSSAYNCLDTANDGLSAAGLLDEAKKEVEAEERLAKKLMKRVYHARSDEESEHENSSQEDEGSDDNSEDDTSSNSSQYGVQLAHLTTEIGTKQRLIDELELSQKRLEAMKAQYEEKLLCLSSKIKATQEERDKVLNSMQLQKPPQGKINQVKEDYEKKLIGMQTELKKWQSAHKEHQKMIRDKGQHERQMNTLRAEVENMKRVKVRLMNQLKEENAKRRDVEAQRNKEIAQLKKAQRRKDIEIRTLESENRMKEQVLKRKHEEVNALKKQSRNATARKALAYGVSPTASQNLKRYSPVKAKSKWSGLQARLAKTVSLKQTILSIEKSMLEYINQRKSAQASVDMLTADRASRLGHIVNSAEINDLTDHIETTEDTLRFLDDKISECQQSIMDLEVTVCNQEAGDSLSNIISTLNKEELGYILEKMYLQLIDELTHSSTCTKDIQAHEQENILLSNEVKRLREMLMLSKAGSFHSDNLSNVTYQSQNIPTGSPMNNFALDHAFPQSLVEESVDISRLPIAKRGLFLGDHYSEPCWKPYGQPVPGPSTMVTNKSRRLTSSRNGFEELGDPFHNPNPTASRNAEDIENSFLNPNDVPALSSGFSRTNSFRDSSRFQRRGTYTLSDANDDAPLHFPVLNAHPPINPGVSRVQSIPRKMLRPGQFQRQTYVASDTGVQRSNTFTTGKVQGRNTLNIPNRPYGGTAPSSPSKHQRQVFDLNTTFISSDKSPEASPPGSPGAVRRSGLGANNDVFQRLTSSMATSSEPTTQNGLILSYPGKVPYKSPLIQTHIANGHSKPVLSIYATQDRLFTASKDATVKLWDLGTGTEIQTLVGHPSTVSCVRYLEESRWILTASSCYIKIWDSRQNKCVTTLQSSGIPIDGTGHHHFDPNNRMLQVPHGERVITDIASSKRSFVMYTPFDQHVRVWDLRCFSSVGLLNGKHNAQVTCMASEDTTKKEILITGSKDHTMKVFEFRSTEADLNSAVPPRATLDPPHYDGIESLALSGSMLFSGSRDRCIKKWDIAKCETVNVMNYVHAGWITGLTFAPRNDGLLLSSSKDGYVKLWSTETCKLLGKVEAAKGGVHCITRNSSIIFTGAENGTIGFWNVKKDLDFSPDSSDNSQ